MTLKKKKIERTVEVNNPPQEDEKVEVEEISLPEVKKDFVDSGSKNSKVSDLGGNYFVSSSVMVMIKKRESCRVGDKTYELFPDETMKMKTEHADYLEGLKVVKILK